MKKHHKTPNGSMDFGRIKTLNDTRIVYVHKINNTKRCIDTNQLCLFNLKKGGF
jgi:hypothetical protein